jgi:16S rRNA (cytidine1402-2'-O)-methyltransferase
VSSAGTPTLSDPGYRLVKRASEDGFRIVPIPGVSAAIAALSVSGLPTDAFVFIGFLPRKEGKRHKALVELIHEKKTMVFYESPRRIAALLEDLINVMGDRHGVLARELTKRHEELIRGNLTEILDSIKARTEVKGECTLVVKGGSRKQGNPDSVREDIRAYLKRPGIKISDMAKTIAARHGLSRQWVYAEALKLKKTMDDTD